jgi:hypothetical protein
MPEDKNNCKIPATLSPNKSTIYVLFLIIVHILGATVPKAVWIHLKKQINLLMSHYWLPTKY